MESGYDQEPVGEGRIRFTVSPAALPRPWWEPSAAALAAVLPILLFSAPDPISGGFWIRIALAASGGWWAFRWVEGRVFRALDRERFPGGTFVVSPGAIEGPRGEDIPRARLERLTLRHREGQGASVSYMLCAMHDGETTMLAGGMAETTARALLGEVTRVLRLS